MALIVNHTDIDAFNKFNSLYENDLLGICHLLAKFSIDVYTVGQYLEIYDVPSIDNVENEPFTNYIRKGHENASSTIAGIVINPVKCDSIKLDESELLAAIVHEVGHIIYFFTENKIVGGSFQEEVYSDNVALRLGLSQRLSSALDKLMNYGNYSTALVEQMMMRKNIIDKNIFN